MKKPEGQHGWAFIPEYDDCRMSDAPFDGKDYPISVSLPHVDQPQWVKAHWNPGGYWELATGGCYEGARFWFNLPPVPMIAKRRQPEYVG